MRGFPVSASSSPAKLARRVRGGGTRTRAGADERLARTMDPPSVPGAPFDQLPADLLVHVAVQLCSGPGLTRMECTCSAWRAAIRSPGPEEMLWKLVTLEKFPRIERVLKVKPTTKTWREIYRSQHRTAPAAPPKPKAEDFVLSFELKKGEQMLAEGAAQLVSPPVVQSESSEDAEDATNLTSAPLWEPEDAPKVLRDYWQTEPSELSSLWNSEPTPKLSIWVTRDLRTAPLYVNVGCEDGLEGVAGFSLGKYEPRELLPEVNPLGKLVSRGWQLEPLLEEADGSVTLRFFSTKDYQHVGEVEQAPGSLILEYLDALVPRANS